MRAFMNLTTPLMALNLLLSISEALTILLSISEISEPIFHLYQLKSFIITSIISIWPILLQFTVFQVQ